MNGLEKWWREKDRDRRKRAPKWRGRERDKRELARERKTQREKVQGWEAALRDTAPVVTEMGVREVRKHRQ